MKYAEIALELRELSVQYSLPRLAELAAYLRRRTPTHARKRKQSKGK